LMRLLLCLSTSGADAAEFRDGGRGMA
jgi:hypothetical protein